MAKPFITIQHNDNCNLDDVSCFSPAPDHRRNAPPLCFIQFAFQYPDLLDPILSINPLFFSTATVLSMDVLPRWQTTASSFFVIFGLFLILANTLVCESLSPCSSVLLSILSPHLVDEVEWNGDGDVAVGEIKRPFSVFRRNNGNSSSRFFTDMQLQENFR